MEKLRSPPHCLQSKARDVLFSISFLALQKDFFYIILVIFIAVFSRTSATSSGTHYLCFIIFLLFRIFESNSPRSATFLCFQQNSLFESGNLSA